MSKQQKDLELITTADGSTTLKVVNSNDYYHSIHGAFQESQLIYINYGLAHVKQNTSINILEIGFGTGLNCLLTLNKVLVEPNHLNIQYHALEPFPIPISVVNQLNYCRYLSAIIEPYFIKIHSADFNNPNAILPNFTLNKYKTGIQLFNSNILYHLVYFDAFAPSSQPEMWTEQVFEKLYHMMCKGGVLVTYCAKGQIKRDLKKVGFEVESLPGPPKKREITRAIKK